MDTEDILLIGAIGIAAWLLLRRPSTGTDTIQGPGIGNLLDGIVFGDGIGNLLDPVPSVTTSEFYSIPYYLDINSGLFNTPAPLTNQNVSREVYG